MTKTPWFPSFIKPVHPGCYEVDFGQQKYGGTAEYQYWDGEIWWYGENHPTNRTVAMVMSYNHKDWRGLATKQGE